jgi:predicted ATP-grasp superfamily ATP-dependent carboligase
MICDTSTPVVVLRSVEHSSLGILRSLGRLRIPVYVMESDRWNPAFFSRYCRERFHYQVADASAEQLITSLQKVAQQLGRRAVLIPTSDDTAMFVADHADVLKKWFLFPAQRSEVARSLASKKEMYFLAKSVGVPTAGTIFPESRADVLQFLQTATFPVVLKGIDVMRLWRNAGKRMFIVRSENELLAAYDALPVSERLNVMLQEYIPGADDTVWMFNGYFNENSDCLIGFTGKKIRQCPVYTGVTSLGICLTNPAVSDTTCKFMKGIGYRGILDIGYKYDARDGCYKVLDVNPRIGATFRLFLANNGMDVARAMYLDLTGQSVQAGSPIEGRKWLVEDLDTVSCFRYARDRKLEFWQWAASYRGIQETAYFASDDPLPLLPMFVIDARKAISRIGKKLRPVPKALQATALQAASEPANAELSTAHTRG